MQTDSVTDTQQARLDGARDQGDNDEDKVSKVDGSTRKRRGVEDAVDATDNSVQHQAAAQVDRPQVSESVHVPNKRLKAEKPVGAPGADDETAPALEAEPAASAAPPAHVGGGFGGLASKGASGFAFGGTSTFGSGGFGSVAFGGNTFGSSAVGATSFTTKASKDKNDDRGSPSVASNAGSVQPIGAFASTAEARGAVPVFRTATAEGEAAQVSKKKPVTGEEGEETVWTCKAALYQFDKEAARPMWRERGTGLLRINVGPNGKARVVMRQLGNLKLLLNAALFPALKLERTEGLPRVSFCCAHSAELAARDDSDEGDVAAAAPDGAGTSTSSQKLILYALKMGSMEKMDDFIEHVERLKMQAPASEEGEAPAGAAADMAAPMPAATAVGSVVLGSKAQASAEDAAVGEDVATQQGIGTEMVSNGQGLRSSPQEGGVVSGGDGMGNAEAEAGAAAAAAAAAACIVDFATH